MREAHDRVLEAAAAVGDVESIRPPVRMPAAVPAYRIERASGYYMLDYLTGNAPDPKRNIPDPMRHAAAQAARREDVT